MTDQPESHFNPYIRYWGDFSAPLRPDLHAIQTYGALFQQVQAPALGAQVILLGVTPELALAPWLERASVTAVDHSPAMIAAIWPGDQHNRHALAGDWFNPPVAPASQDVIIGDGVLIFLAYPGEHQQLASSLSSLLRSKGHLIIRAFCSAEQPENPEEIIRRAKNRELKNIHECKLLLLAALQQGKVNLGVELSSVWKFFYEHFTSPQDCAQQTDWSISQIQTIELYKDNPKRYFLATPAEIEAAMAEHFELVTLSAPPTPWACPTPLMCFQKRG